MNKTSRQEALYVASTLPNLLTCFLDARHMRMPDFRHRLSQQVVTPHMPITQWWAMLEELQSALPDEPALGLQIGLYSQAHHAGVLGYLIQYSDTLGQALIRFSRFQRLLHNLVPLVISQSDDELVIGWGKSAQKSTLLSDDVFSSGLLTIFRQITGRPDLHATRATSVHPAPADVRPYELALGCQIQFESAEGAMHLPGWAWELPIQSQDQHLTNLLEQQAETQLQTMPAADAWLVNLKQQIVAALQDGSAEAATVATRMHMSERALYRALQERGMRYKQVLNALRQDLSQAYLRDPLLSLPEIALLLGYAEQSVFSRAFKEWTGEPPLRWRRRALHGEAVSAHANGP